MKLHIGGIFLCGIGGMLSYERDAREKRYVLDSMLETLKLRGPNENGIYVDENCGLAHTRLNVLDIDGGKQPMEYIEDGKKYYIVCDGSLYNTTELRRELYSKGYSFKGHSDTEVILKSLSLLETTTPQGLQNHNLPFLKNTPKHYTNLTM